MKSRLQNRVRMASIVFVAMVCLCFNNCHAMAGDDTVADPVGSQGYGIAGSDCYRAYNGSADSVRKYAGNGSG